MPSGDPVLRTNSCHPDEKGGETPDASAGLFPLGFKADPDTERRTLEFYLKSAHRYAVLRVGPHPAHEGLPAVAVSPGGAHREERGLVGPRQMDDLGGHVPARGRGVGVRQAASVRSATTARRRSPSPARSASRSVRMLMRSTPTASIEPAVAHGKTRAAAGRRGAVPSMGRAATRIV
jgi:hypothetical protein